MELAELQDAEVGDGTTSVVILAAELLKRANELVKLSIHPTNIISGYRLAMREVSSGDRGNTRAARSRRIAPAWGGFQACMGRARGLSGGQGAERTTAIVPLQACKFIEEHMALKVDKLPKETLLNCAKTAMSSKVRPRARSAGEHVHASMRTSHACLPKLHARARPHAVNPLGPCSMHAQITGSDEAFFSQLVVDAIQSVRSEDPLTGKVKYPVRAINILKAHGKSARESCLLNGYALNLGRAAQGMPKSVKGAKIACLDMNLQKNRMMMGVQVRSVCRQAGLVVCSAACMAWPPLRSVGQAAAAVCRAGLFRGLLP